MAPLQDHAAARIHALLGNVVTSALAAPLSPAELVESVPQRCHVTSLRTENALRFERFVVAPTGITLAVVRKTA